MSLQTSNSSFSSEVKIISAPFYRKDSVQKARFGREFLDFSTKVDGKSLNSRIAGVALAAAGTVGAVAVVTAAIIGLIAMTAGLAIGLGIAGIICLGAIIGGITLYVKNRKINIYANELNELLNNSQKELKNGKKQSFINSGTKNNPSLAKNKMLFFLNEMLNKDESSDEYRSAKAFLEKDGGLQVANFLKNGHDNDVKRDAIALLLKHGNDEQKGLALSKINDVLNDTQSNWELYNSAKYILENTDETEIFCWLRSTNDKLREALISSIPHMISVGRPTLALGCLSKILDKGVNNSGYESAKNVLESKSEQILDWLEKIKIKG